MEQYSRLNNVEIKGIPVTKGENCAAILTAVGDAIACALSSADFDVIHRVPTKFDDVNIIPVFVVVTRKMILSGKHKKPVLGPIRLVFRARHTSGFM